MSETACQWCGAWACTVFRGEPCCLSCAFQRRINRIEPTIPRETASPPTPVITPAATVEIDHVIEELEADGWTVTPNPQGNWTLTRRDDGHTWPELVAAELERRGE